MTTKSNGRSSAASQNRPLLSGGPRQRWCSPTTAPCRPFQSDRHAAAATWRARLPLETFVRAILIGSCLDRMSFANCSERWHRRCLWCCIRCERGAYKRRNGSGQRLINCSFLRIDKRQATRSINGEVSSAFEEDHSVVDTFSRLTRGALQSRAWMMNCSD